ncbi:hypothetical protein AB3662_43300 [Sorangium cellulosum]|uniref:hypothetical protein n=1 Tax=Sorangium cellulosum TaxID=56 RepID=UPI003D9A677B
MSKELTMSIPPSIHGFSLLLSAASVLAAAGCVADPSSDAGEPVGDSHQSFDEWKASLPRDPNDGAYLVDGDIGVHDDVTLKELSAERQQPGALIVNRRADGSDDRWSDEQKMNLTYCVSPRFGDDHDAVVAATRSAGSTWAGAAAVRFVYQPDEDEACESEEPPVLFEVVPANGTTYNGRAFLPSMVARGYHQVFIDLENIARARSKTLTGVLRHELGHVLGFRHEHARPEGNGACTERPAWRALTPYDPASVMHYNAASRCQGTNAGDYVLTSLDEAGAAELYGEPR